MAAGKSETTLSQNTHPALKRLRNYFSSEPEGALLRRVSDTWYTRYCLEYAALNTAQRLPAPESASCLHVWDQEVVVPSYVSSSESHSAFVL